MAKQERVLHFSDGEKIICGVKNGDIAVGDQVVNCKRCIALLQQAEKKREEPVDPKAIHFSDGKKNICGTTGTGVKDEQKVTCPKCQEYLSAKAQGTGDPLIWCKVKNEDLEDGVDFGFYYEGKSYLLYNNKKVRLPKSVIEHLRLVGYPYKRYVPDQEEGHAMQVAGFYQRFVIQIL